MFVVWPHREGLAISPIKPDSHVFPVGGIGFRPIPCGKDRYRLEPENSCDNICTIRDLEDEIRTASGLSVNVVESVLGTLGRVWVETRDGRRLGACAVEISGRDVLNVRFVPDAPMREEDRECRIVVMTCGTIEAAEAEGSKKLFRLERDVTYIGKTSR